MSEGGIPMDDDVIDIVNNYRMKLPKYQEDTNKQINFIKKNFLIIPSHELLNDTIECCKTTSDLMQSIYVRLELVFESTRSSIAYQNMQTYSRTIEQIQALILYLQNPKNKLSVEKLARIYVLHLSLRVTLLKKLLSAIEISYLLE